MKKLGKLNINPEKVMKNEELITLRGGYSDGDNYSWDCMGEPNFYLGCVSTITNVASVAWSYCEWKWGPTDYVLGPYDHHSSCDVW